MNNANHPLDPNHKTPWNPSKRATARVKDPAPIPQECPNCGESVEIVHHNDVYGRAYGSWPWMYKCTSLICDSYVGMHPYTNIPLGTLADEPTRDARRRTKKLFHQYLDKYGLTRSEGYINLAGAMGRPKSEVHFGMFEIADCFDAYEALYRMLRS